MKRFLATAVLATGLSVACANLAFAQSGVLGELQLLGYKCPPGWATANGALLSIQQNQGLFSLYNTRFGGDGKTTFGLPNLTAPQSHLTWCVVTEGIMPPLR